MFTLLFSAALAWAAPAQEPVTLHTHNLEIHGVRYLNAEGRPNNGKWVLLTHGLHSNYHEFDHVVKELVEAGYDCWAFNFRGHGNGEERSRVHAYTDGAYRLEHMATADLPMMLDYVRSHNSRKGFILGHSMGGMVPRAAIARGTLDQSVLESVILLGSPPHFRRGNPLRASGLLKPLEFEIYRAKAMSLSAWPTPPANRARPRSHQSRQSFLLVT